MLDDEESGRRRVDTAPGSLALATPGDDAPADFTRGREPIELPAPEHPWSLAGSLADVHIVDERSHAAALDAVLRGADVVARPDVSREAAFRGDLDRLVIRPWSPPRASTAPAPWEELLAALATGATTEEAARRCHVSVRSAHRRLAEARTALGVTTTAAAVARWSGSGPRN